MSLKYQHVLRVISPENRCTLFGITRHHTKPDRRAGLVLIAVYVLGILGASLATVMNGGELPRSAQPKVHLAKMTAPM